MRCKGSRVRIPPLRPRMTRVSNEVVDNPFVFLGRTPFRLPFGCRFSLAWASKPSCESESAFSFERGSAAPHLSSASDDDSRARSAIRVSVSAGAKLLARSPSERRRTIGMRRPTSSIPVDVNERLTRRRSSELLTRSINPRLISRSHTRVTKMGADAESGQRCPLGRSRCLAPMCASISCMCISASIMCSAIRRRTSLAFSWR